MGEVYGTRINGKAYNLDAIVSRLDEMGIGVSGFPQICKCIGVGEGFLKKAISDRENGFYSNAMSLVLERFSKFLGVKEEDLLVDIPSGKSGKNSNANKYGESEVEEGSRIMNAMGVYYSAIGTRFDEVVGELQKIRIDVSEEVLEDIIERIISKLL